LASKIAYFNWQKMIMSKPEQRTPKFNHFSTTKEKKPKDLNSKSNSYI